ncbi:MAG: proton-conducting transporter membrane subunit [Sulfuricellaceae bacterium]|nr:proton-conducting transporter membrane subunit [Sulfuricellaceae bacterium]
MNLENITDLVCGSPWELVWLAPLLPLLAAAGIALRMLLGHDKGDLAEPLTARLAVLAAFLSLLVLLRIDLAVLQSGLPGQVRTADWLSSGSMSIAVSFTLDALSLAFATLVALISTLTLMFSRSYLHREIGFHRFFMAMSLFVSGMLLIVLAGNVVLAFVGWELAGVSSWMLIGYAYQRPTATGNALRAILSNRVGDAGFMLGISLALIWLGSVEWSAILQTQHMGTLSSGLLALGFVVAALAKSGQIPFSPWIARALEGPTPSSAIFYGALMVHAGVYLLIRLEPLLRHAPALMSLIAIIGLLTALYGYFSGLTQTDVKSALMFATTTQVGLMFFACGMGWFTLAAWHMGLHASWRAWQFLASPAYMHLIGNSTRPAPAWLRNKTRFYTAALQRFWLENLGDALLVRPTQQLARDVRNLDDNIVSRLVGMPKSAVVPAFIRASGEDMNRDQTARGSGLAGSFLQWVAQKLHDFESRLLFQGNDGHLSRILAQVGEYLLAVEGLLTQPRYMLMLVMATLVVIL